MRLPGVGVENGVIQQRHRDHERRAIEERLDQAPRAHEQRQQRERNPRGDRHVCRWRDGALDAVRFVCESKCSRGLPDRKQRHQREDRHDGREDIRQRRPEIVRDEELRDGERDAGDERGRPDLCQATPSRHQHDQVERQRERQHRQLPSDHLRERVQVEAGDLAGGHERDADAAERDRRGVRDETEARRVPRVEAEADEHARGDGHRRAEAGAALEERPEAERDEQRLQPAIVGERGDRVLEDVEAPGADGDLVERQRAEDDPANREDAVARAVDRRHHCERHRHAVDADSDHERESQRQRAGADRRPSRDDERPQQRKNRNRRDGRGGERMPERIERLRPHPARILSDRRLRIAGCGLLTRGAGLQPHPADAVAVAGHSPADTCQHQALSTRGLRRTPQGRRPLPSALDARRAGACNRRRPIGCSRCRSSTIRRLKAVRMWDRMASRQRAAEETVTLGPRS